MMTKHVWVWIAMLCVWCVGSQVGLADQPTGGRMLKVVQFNYQRANLFSPKGKTNGRNLQDAILILKHLNPDLLNINEIEAPQAAEIAKALDCNFVFAPVRANETFYGEALFCRGEVIGEKVYYGEGLSEDSYRAVELITEFEGQKLHFFGTHPRFNDKPIKEKQMLDLMDIVTSSTGPRILIGDFNDMDNRPNWYSHKGFINIITGGIHGTYLDSTPKFYDFQRKCGVPAQTKYNPPYFSLKTDWDGPDNTANSISQWAPKVRIDHIFVSPDFYLDDSRNRCETMDTLPLLKELDPNGKPRIVGDHRMVVAEVLLPKPATTLVAYPDLGPLVLPVGKTYQLRVGALDADGCGVSLFDTDVSAPKGDPAVTGRIIPKVDFEATSDCITVKRNPFPADYDAYIKGDRPSAASAAVQAVKPGKAQIKILARNLQTTVEVIVLAKGEQYVTEIDKTKKFAK